MKLIRNGVFQVSQRTLTDDKMHFRRLPVLTCVIEIKILAGEVNCLLLIYRNIITKEVILKLKDKKCFKLISPFSNKTFTLK